MKETSSEQRPAAVAERPKQAGETQARWTWVERAVWTERMLAALETGVKGGKWCADHQRWPNAYFQEQGLFTMTEARKALCRS